MSEIGITENENMDVVVCVSTYQRDRVRACLPHQMLNKDLSEIETCPMVTNSYVPTSKEVRTSIR